MSNKPVEIEIILRESIVKGIKEAQAAFKELDSSAKASTINFKAQIAEQRQAIKQIESDIKNMIAERDKLTSTQAKSNANVEIAAARRALAEEKDLLIKTQTSAAAANKAEEASQGGIIASLGKWAIGLATVTGAMKLGKAIIEATEETGHKFEQVITAAADATNVFFQAVASGDWSNFTDNIGKAIDGAVEYIDKMEEVNNMKNQDLVTSSKFDKQIADELQFTYDRSRGNDKNRLAHLNNAIDLSEKKFTPLIETAEKERDVKLNRASSATGGKIKPEDIKDFIEEYRSLEKMLEKGKRYNEAANYIPKVSQTGYISDSELKKVDDYRKEVELLGESGKKAGEKVKQISLITPESRKELAQLVAQVVHLKAQAEGQNKFLKRQRGTLETRIEEDAKNAAKKAKEGEGLDNRIKATKDLMDETKDANSAEFAALTQKLVLLEKEKNLREEIVKMQMMIATNKEMIPKGATSVGEAIHDMAKALGVDLDKTKPLETKLDISGINKQMAAYEKKANELRKEYHIEEKKELKELGKEWYAVADAADSVSRAIAESNAGLAEMLVGVAQTANQLGNLARTGIFTKDKETKQYGKMSTADAISATVSGTTQLIGIVASAAASRKKVMDEYYSSIISQQHQYNLLLNEQLRLNSDVNGSLFLKDYEGRLKSSTEAYNNAQQKYQDEFKKFATAEAIVGKKNVVSGQNVLSGIGAGAAAGAGIGAILGGGVLSLPAAAAGAIIGSVVGALTGLFAKKKKDITAPLLETYPKLIKATGEFDEALAKTLITNKQVTEATAATLQKLIDWKEAAQKARDQLSQVITDLAGSMGDDLRNALVTAFQDGTDASKAFGDSVNKTLSNILSNMIFNRVFEGAFKELDKGMKASYGIGEDGKPIYGSVVDYNWVDDFKKFMDQKGALTDQFNKAMVEWKQTAAESGFDLFGKDSSKSSAKGMTTDIKAITEESASQLVGATNAMRLNIAKLLENNTNGMTMLQKSLEYQLRTADNTEDTAKTLREMKGQLTRFELDGIKMK